MSLVFVNANISHNSHFSFKFFIFYSSLLKFARYQIFSFNSFLFTRCWILCTRFSLFLSVDIFLRYWNKLHFKIIFQKITESWFFKMGLHVGSRKETDKYKTSKLLPRIKLVKMIATLNPLSCWLVYIFLNS